jgi:hypothetical protein
MLVVPTCVGSDHFGSYVRNLSLHFCKRLFPGLEPMTPWSQSNSFTTAPGHGKLGAKRAVTHRLELRRHLSVLHYSKANSKNVKT